MELFQRLNHANFTFMKSKQSSVQAWTDSYGYLNGIKICLSILFTVELISKLVEFQDIKFSISVAWLDLHSNTPREFENWYYPSPNNVCNTNHRISSLLYSFRQTTKSKPTLNFIYCFFTPFRIWRFCDSESLILNLTPFALFNCLIQNCGWSQEVRICLCKRKPRNWPH